MNVTQVCPDVLVEFVIFARRLQYLVLVVVVPETGNILSRLKRDGPESEIDVVSRIIYLGFAILLDMESGGYF